MKALEYPFDSAELLSGRKRLRRELLADGKKRIKKKIAVLSGATANDIVKSMELFLLDNAIEPEFYESEYAQWWQDAVFGTPELDAFEPDIIYICTSYRNIERFLPDAGDGDPEAKFAECCDYFTAAWEALEKRYNCPIIQNNIELPPYRVFGNSDGVNANGATRLITKMNLFIADRAAAKSGFYVFDLNYAASAYGLRRWYDLKAWCMFKYPMAPEATVYVGAGVASVIKSLYGKNKKAIALDLDNTLWGGVVGDDGVEGIEIGRETATSECYEEFQKYLKKLRSVGVMLTVASKNDHENAIAGLNHPEGILRPDDFIVIKANWETKDRNIAATAAEMDIGADAFVFADDNPVERALVSRSLPFVAVPEMTDPATYIDTLDGNAYFEITSFSKDDLGRNEMYKANAKRAQKQHEFTDYGEYLLSLGMKAEILPFSGVYIPRITQLTNKSNQFNLTTRRYTEPEITAAAQDGKHITLYGKLGDIYGDNGVVAVVIASLDGERADIDLWLMSCRVLKRGMEHAMLDELVRLCAKSGIKEIVGHYYPTAKNSMVSGLYESFGFAKLSQDDEGTHWSLKVEGYKNQNKAIKVNE